MNRKLILQEGSIIVLAESRLQLAGMVVVATFVTAVIFLSIRQQQNSRVVRHWLAVAVLLCPILLLGLLMVNSQRTNNVLTFAITCLCFCMYGFAKAKRGVPGDVIREEIFIGVWHAMAIGTVAIAGAILFMPPIEQSRESARRTQCRNNLKRIGLAFHQFHDQNGRFPSASGSLPLSKQQGPGPKRPPVSWRVALLPNLDLQNLYAQYDLSAAWNSEVNKPLQSRQVIAFQCPSALNSTASDGTQRTSYLVPTGPGTIFSSAAAVPVRLQDMESGTGHAILAFETHTSEVVWTNPQDVDFTAKNAMPQISSDHSGGANVLTADGSVQFLSKDTDSKVIARMLQARNSSATDP